MTARGQAAVDIAERFRVFIFPKAGNGSILDPIAANNGRDLDGTPILTSASQIDNLVAKGFAERCRAMSRDGR